MVLAVRFYDVILWLHITAVVIAFGALFAYPVFLTVNARAPIGQRAALHRVQIAFSKRVTGPTIGLILLAGIYLASDAGVWGRFWVIAPVVLLFVIAGLGATVLRRGEERLLELAEAGAEKAYPGALSVLLRWTWIVLVLIVLTIFIMVAKPFG
jgi:hypothetical protein